MSVRTVLLHSIKQYPCTKREEWVIEHPGQCVLNGSQVLWTQEVEDSLNNKVLKEYYEGLTSQLDKTV
jgi:dynein heavy chain, axonemal